MSETHEIDDIQNSKPDQREDDFLQGDQEDRNNDSSRNPVELERNNSQDNGDREERKEYRENQGGRGDRGDDEELRAKRIFVGNLSFKTSWQGLKDFMRKVGKVERVDIFENRDGQSKGFGLVQFSTVEEAQQAVREMNQQELDGRKIFVREDDAKHTKSGPRPTRERRERRFSPRRRSNSRSRSRSRSRSNERRRHRDSRRRSPSRSRSDSRSRSRTRRDRRDDRHERRRDRSRSRSRSGGRRGGSRDRRDRDRDDRRGGGRGEGVQLVVKNMPWSVTWQQLKDAFKEYGNVLRADVPQDDKGRSKGFGYVRFEKEKDASKAIEGMHGAAFNGRKIQVEMSHSN